MAFSAMPSLFVLLLVACILSVTAEDIHCPPDYMTVSRYGRQQCNQVVWRDLQLTRFKSEFPLPMVRSEGWPNDTWNMCMHGTLGPVDTNFVLKLWRPEDDVAQLKAIFWQNNSTVVLEEYEEGHLVGEHTIAPKPYPFANNQRFYIAIQISGDTITYNLCGDECFTIDRYLDYSDIFTLQIFMQASVDFLDLWCM